MEFHKHDIKQRLAGLRGDGCCDGDEKEEEEEEAGHCFVFPCTVEVKTGHLKKIQWIQETILHSKMKTNDT